METIGIRATDFDAISGVEIIVKRGFESAEIPKREGIANKR